MGVLRREPFVLVAFVPATSIDVVTAAWMLSAIIYRG